MAPPLVRFPSNPITPHGAYHLLHDRIPMMRLTSPDETVCFDMMGGLAIPDFVNSPGRVEIKDLKGLIPPWRIIDQKGATQHGVTFVTSLYDPIEPELTVRVKGKDPADCRRVARYLMDSLDVDETSRLAWFTHQLGYWWADVRWHKTPVDMVGGIRNKTQELSLRLRADNAFWQSYPCVDEFSFAYEESLDLFNDEYSSGMGPKWDVAYSGGGSGEVRVENGQVNPHIFGGRLAVARRNDYISPTNTQVVDIHIGALGQWFGFASDVSLEAWARMNNTGTPGTSGVRMSLQRHRVGLTIVSGGVQVGVLKLRDLIIPPRTGERWRLIAGEEGNDRVYTVMRNSSVMIKVKEPGTQAPLGAANRSSGVGFHANTTSRPPSLRRWSVGTNSTASQSGFIRMVNVGDQDMYYNYIVEGQGTFRFWNGPGAGPDEYVEFGPLVAGQRMYLRTNPEKRGVVDMTAENPSPQHLTAFQKALKEYLSFATGNNAGALADQIISYFGVRPPQGNPYKMLKGRWSRASAIPKKSPGKPAEPYYTKVEIDNGNADSKIIATGIPLRRMPW